MRLFVFMLCFVVAVMTGPAHAFVPTSFNGVVNNALGSIVQKKALSRGFSANDAKMATTGNKIGGTLLTVAGTVASVANAPWLALAFGLGAIAYETGLVDLAVDGLKKYGFNSDGSVTTQDKTDINVPAGPAGVVYCHAGVCASTAQGACGAKPSTTFASGGVNVAVTYRWENASCWRFHDGVKYSDVGVPSAISSGCIGINLSPASGQCPASNFPLPAPKLQTAAQVYDELQALPQAERIKPVNPAIVANMANEAWRRAAALPDYTGIPYDATNPITQADVQVWRQENPTAYPQVADMLASPMPASTSGGSAATAVPVSTAPATEVQPTASGGSAYDGVNVMNKVAVDLGPDPGVGMPTLEEMPTVAQILDPIFNLMPSLRSFTVPQHTATCPTGSVNLFGQTQAFEAHCDLLDDVRPVLSAAMALVWAFIALRITLSA